MNVHVCPEAEQEGVIVPVKFAPDADTGMFTELVPTTIVVVGEEEERAN